MWGHYWTSVSERVRKLYICIALLFACVSFLRLFSLLCLPGTCLPFTHTVKAAARDEHLFSRHLVVPTNRSGCSISALAWLARYAYFSALLCLRCVCPGQLCLVASHVIDLHVLRYPPFQIFWDPSSNLRLLRLSPSPGSLKDLSISLHFPASGLQIVGRSLFQLHQQWDNTVCKLSELLSLKGVKCHGILVFSGSAPHWACSCKLCIQCVRNDSCGLWHQHSGLDSTVKLPARKKKLVLR